MAAADLPNIRTRLEIQFRLLNAIQQLQNQQKYKLQMQQIKLAVVAPHKCGAPPREVMEIQCQSHL